VNVIALQFDIAWENKPANFEKVRRLLSQVAAPQGALVALPEMFATGFSMNSDTIAEPLDGETEQFLADAAREFGIFLVAGAALRDQDGKARNNALVHSPKGERLALYAKMRLFTPSGEHEHYTPGDRPVTFSCGDCAVSPFICYDLRFPELFRKVAGSHQPELFVIIANWPEKRIHHWVRLLQARAIENQAYVVGVNRVGSDPHYTYGGRSVVIDPHGEILANAGKEEGSAYASLDISALRKYREGLPFLADMKLTLGEDIQP